MAELKIPPYGTGRTPTEVITVTIVNYESFDVYNAEILLPTPAGSVVA